MARTEHVRFMVMVPNYWGIGDTIDDAMETLLSHGGRIHEGGFTLLEFPPTTIFQSVDGVYGTVTFNHADGESPPQEPIVRTVSTEEALTLRKAAITRALITDDIDADLADDLRYERDAIDENLKDLATL